MLKELYFSWDVAVSWDAAVSRQNDFVFTFLNATVLSWEKFLHPLREWSPFSQTSSVIPAGCQCGMVTWLTNAK